MPRALFVIRRVFQFPVLLDAATRAWLGCVMVAMVFLASSGIAAGEPPSEPRAARSVHLWYDGPEADLFHNEIVVEESQAGSYFAVCGFQHGYFGIQQRTRPNDRVVIFSVWDPGKQNDARSVPEDRRVRVLSQGKGVLVKRFGGEGTGAQSFFRYDWKPGERYRFTIRAKRLEQRTAFAAFFYLNETKTWKHIATFATLSRDSGIRGFYSFVEDFRRDGRSPRERRAAVFSRGWVRSLDGRWKPLLEATFTADRTPLSNINAEVAGDGFRLATGGTTRQTLALGKRLRRTPTGLAVPAFPEFRLPRSQP